MDNKMMKVAKLLGVELEEEFEIMGAPVGCVYKLSEKGVALYHKEENWWEMLPHMLTLLLTGECKIVKLPWKPECGEQYYVPYVDSTAMFTTWVWRDDELDLDRLRRKLVFSTPDEAAALAKKMLKLAEKTLTQEVEENG